MQFTLTSFIALLAAVGVSAQGAADPSINTPTGVVQCLPVQITFSGTAPPFFVTIQPGGNANAAAIVDLGSTSSNSITWIANQPAGTSLTLVIRDSQGRTNPSAPFTVLPGSDSSCLGSTGSSSTAATGPTSTQPATSAGGGSSAAGGASATTTTRPAGSTTTRATAASSSTPNAAMSVQPVGLAGLMGLVGLAALI